MKIKILLILTSIIFLLTWPNQAVAQQRGSWPGVAPYGSVVDQNGNPIVSATVEWICTDPGCTAKGNLLRSTDNTGTYTYSSTDANFIGNILLTSSPTGYQIIVLSLPNPADNAASCTSVYFGDQTPMPLPDIVCNITTSTTTPTPTPSSSPGTPPLTPTPSPLVTPTPSPGTGGTPTPSPRPGTPTPTPGTQPRLITGTCSGDPNPAIIGQSVTWTANIRGGTSPYLYSWSGSGALQGKTGNPVTVSYFNTNTQTGSVVITDSTGTSAQITCSNLLIGSPFYYSVSNSGNITVNQGGAGSNVITLALTSGITMPVSLQISGLPSGANTVASPTSCSPSCYITLGITTQTSTPTGDYLITVTGNPPGWSKPPPSTTFHLIVNAASSSGCPGTCGPQSGPPSQYPDAYNGTCLDNSTGQRGWWNWDLQPANSSCTDQNAPYCFSCKSISSSTSTGGGGSSGTQLPATVRDIFSGPLLWGKVVKDVNYSALFSGNPVIGQTELNNSFLNASTGSSVSGSGGPNGSITAYTPNVMRGPMTYSVSYSGNHVNPAYLTRTFSFSGISATTNPQPVTTGSTVTDNKSSGCYSGNNNTTTVTATVPNLPGVIKTTYTNNYQCCPSGAGSCTNTNESKTTYDIKTTTNISCANDSCTILAMPNYSTFTQFPSGLSHDDYGTYYGVDGSLCSYSSSAQACQSACYQAPAGLCTGGTDANGNIIITSCKSGCSTSCTSTGGIYTYSYSCANTNTQAAGWQMFHGEDQGTDTRGGYDKNSVFGFIKSGVQQASVTYSGLIISNPLTGPTDDLTDPNTLFNTYWTIHPEDRSNPYCWCEQDPFANPDCTGYGWTCPSLPAKRSNRFLPGGDYLFQIAASTQMSLQVKVDGNTIFSGTSSPDSSGKLHFNFSLPNSLGSAVVMTLSSTFTDPNNLPPVTIGPPELYPLGYYEASFSTDSSTAFTTWCATNLTMNNKPISWATQEAAQSTDNIWCSSAATPGLGPTNFTTSLDAYSLIEADLLLAGQYNSISGQYFLDANLNGIKDSNESYLSVGGNLSVSGTPGYTIFPQVTGYTVHNLKPGNYALNFSPNSPYRISLPGSIAGFNVTVGSNCTPQVLGASIGQCTAQGDIINLDFGISPITCAWIQTFGGDVHSNTSINTPCGP